MGKSVNQTMPESVRKETCMTRKLPKESINGMKMEKRKEKRKINFTEPL